MLVMLTPNHRDLYSNIDAKGEGGLKLVIRVGKTSCYWGLLLGYSQKPTNRHFGSLVFGTLGPKILCIPTGLALGRLCWAGGRQGASGAGAVILSSVGSTSDVDRGQPCGWFVACLRVERQGPKELISYIPELCILMTRQGLVESGILAKECPECAIFVGGR